MTGGVHANGARFHVEQRGDAGAEPVVFVHLGGADWRYWEGQLEAFASAGYRAVAYSRRYSWPNDNPMRGDYSALVDADDLDALLDALAVDGAHVVGASIGACAALALAVRRPALVRSLVVAEPPMLSWAAEGRPAALPEVERFMREIWEPTRAAFIAGDDERAMATLMDYFVAPGALHAFPERLRRRVMEGARDWEAQVLSSVPFPSLPLAEMRTLPQPVLMLSGGRTLPMHAAVDAALERTLRARRAPAPPFDRITFANATHDVWTDAGHECRAATLAFLDGGSRLSALGPRLRSPGGLTGCTG